MPSQDTVFISYAREDARYAERLYADLRSAEINAWLDTKCLLPGQEWRREIRKAIKNSRYFIALLSSSSLTKRGYVQSEIRQALDALEEIPRGKVFLIPARIDGVSPEDEELQNLNWVDLFPNYRSGFSRILTVLQDVRRIPLSYGSSARAPISYTPFRNFGEFARDFIEKLPSSSALTDRDYSIYLKCDTRHPELKIPKNLIEKFPEQIPLVLQNQFEGLNAGSDAMSVVLWFSGVPQTVSIPYEAIIEISLPKIGVRIENFGR